MTSSLHEAPSRISVFLQKEEKSFLRNIINAKKITCTNRHPTEMYEKEADTFSRGTNGTCTHMRNPTGNWKNKISGNGSVNFFFFLFYNKYYN